MYESLGSFRNRKSAHRFCLPIRKSQVRKFLSLFCTPQIPKFLQNAAQLCLKMSSFVGKICLRLMPLSFIYPPTHSNWAIYSNGWEREKEILDNLKKEISRNHWDEKNLPCWSIFSESTKIVRRLDSIAWTMESVTKCEAFTSRW